MRSPGTAREALIAEAIGDLAGLLDRVDTLLPALAASSRTLDDAGQQLSEQLTTFEEKVIATTEKLKLHSVNFILLRAEQEARRMVEAHTRAMSEAVRPLFKAEIDLAQQQLAAPLQRIAELEHHLRQWLVYTVLAIAASNLLVALSIWLSTR